MATSDATVGLTPDQYGQLHPIETEELLARKRVEFEDELAKVPAEQKIHLTEAEEKCPELLTDDFKLMFLRSEVFNADLAVKRYAKYWEKRLEIFGPERAFLPLTLDGALKDDTVALTRGFINYVADASDEKGRAIIYADPGRQDKTLYERESMARAAWYFLHAALERSDVQKHGIILMMHPKNPKLSQFDRTLARLMMGSMQGAIPMRLSAIHICQPPSFLHVILPFIRLFMAKHVQKRINVHFGSIEKIRPKLESFEITKANIPVQLGGEATFDMLVWLEERRAAGK